MCGLVHRVYCDVIFPTQKPGCLRLMLSGVLRVNGRWEGCKGLMGIEISDSRRL